MTAIGHGGNTFGFTADATFYPDHGLGLIVLTNASGANAYTGAVKRRLMELLFDADPIAEKNLAFGVKQNEEAIARQMAEVSLTPDAAFVDPLLGKWTNPRLGTLEIRREPDGVVLDAGEWQGPVGTHTDKSGVRRIILTGPPFAGLPFWPQTQDGKSVLLFETAQQKYVFERAAR